MPEAIIVDEIGTEAEAAAARTIAERGVQLVATAHGNTLENLVLNPTLSDLIGGVHTVTLSDEEAHRRGTQKTINERRAPPTFDIVVELVGRDEVLVHGDTADAVDRLLAGEPVGGERRTKDGQRVAVEELPPEPEPPIARVEGLPEPTPEPRRVYLHAVSRDVFERVTRDLRLDLHVVRQPSMADVILALRGRANDPKVRRGLERTGKSIFTVKRNSSAEIRRILRHVFPTAEGHDAEEVREAVAEAEHAMRRVMAENVSVPLAPRPPALRRLQHRLVARYHLDATSIGSEPLRHLVILPPDGRGIAPDEPGG